MCSFLHLLPAALFKYS